MADKVPPPAYVQPYSNEYIDSLYKRFGQIESSGGKNTKHKMIKTGPNAGQTAGGETGILPNSLKDFINQSRNAGLAVDPEIETLSQLPHEMVTDALNTEKDLDRKAFDMSIRRMLNKTGGDEEKMALGWNTGHNRDYSAIPQTTLNTNKYVQDFKKTKSNEGYEKIRGLLGQLNPVPQPIPNDFTPDREMANTDEDKINALKAYRNRLP